MEPRPLLSEEIERIGSDGFFVRDNFLGEPAARAIRREADVLAASGLLKPAGIRRAASHAMDSAIRSDQTMWLDRHNSSRYVEIGRLIDVFEWLQGELNLKAYFGVRRFDVQLSQFPRFSRYVRHADSFSGAHNRRVTALYYLNPEWGPASGGRLRIHVGDSFLDVDPIQDRLVVFASERLDHEVLEVFEPRMAITAWYYAGPP